MKLNRVHLLVVALSLIIGGIAGYIMNILSLCNSPDGISGLDMVRLAGIFIAPLGAVVGWF